MPTSRAPGTTLVQFNFPTAASCVCTTTAATMDTAMWINPLARVPSVLWLALNKDLRKST